MIRLAILSDLHIDYHKLVAADGPEVARLWGLDAAGVARDAIDAIVIPGDIYDGFAAEEAPGKTCNEAAWHNLQNAFGCPAHVVLGNHDPYDGAFPESTLEIVEVPGRFEHNAGQTLRMGLTTLWTQIDPVALAEYLETFRAPMLDMEVIQGWSVDRLNRENRKARRLLRRAAGTLDVIVTHHAPSKKSISPQYSHLPWDTGNAFFCNDLWDEEIVSFGANVWLHGHVHDSFDYEVRDHLGTTTRVVCNPLGYSSDREITGFRPVLIDVDPMTTHKDCSHERKAYSP